VRRQIAASAKVVAAFLWEFAVAVLAVLGLISLAFWAVEVVKEGKHPLNFWLVVSLAILLAAAILWGLRKGGRQPGSIATNVYNAPVTQHIFGAGAGDQSAQAAVVGEQPQAPSSTIGGPSPDEPKLVQLSDYIEFSESGPPTIRHRHFKNVTIRGPLIIALDRVNFINGGFGHPGDDRESMWWEVFSGREYSGIALVQFCTFENFRSEAIGFALTREAWSVFTDSLRANGDTAHGG
jgi:hypothetical protein